MQREQEHRRFRRTREYGTQTLAVTYTVKNGKDSGQCEAKLYDFSEGGLGMDAPRPFQADDVIEVEGELKGKAYSMQITARGRVIYCRRLDSKSYRVGLSFVDISYRPILG